ncbi:ABC transporter ATP-binding protein [Chitinophaga sp. Mgbs1]|uniref:ABC transporter ATP-binding protein n=1 Tax=Chitinophaga solisilvae TaxID=1233460 RepID=A0A433WN93_9BACT|nr:ABC transporter ATP-binding protein [Chitinophaga solisilvae]
MNYNLSKDSRQETRELSVYAAFKSLLKLISHERQKLILALLATLANSALSLLGPLLAAYVIDTYITRGEYSGVLLFSGILLFIYILAFFTNYLQMKLMGTVGQRALFTLRNAVFHKLQHLPVAFFNQNKAGDLISRVNNDTDKLNQFFSQALMQFIGGIITMTGAGIFLVSLNVKLGLASLAPALVILVITQVLSPWVKKKNARNLQTVGALSAEIQESLSNFKVIVAFGRRDYFMNRFGTANKNNYTTAKAMGIANQIFVPLYTLFSAIAQLIVLCYGVYLITTGVFTVGLLLSYLAYTNFFYSPLRQMATLWASFQTAMAGWERISEILVLENNMTTLEDQSQASPAPLLEMKQVHFAYPEGKEILHNINIALEKGKTYALVGPTGGGKTTTASLIARLYDPVKGTVLLNGKDIRAYSAEDRTRMIGFILQDPILFTGTVRENILYGNDAYENYTNEQLEEVIRGANLEKLLAIFEQGLETQVQSAGESVSLGQKQLIAFMRAVLRKPALLILDEATANIDTVTEKLLGEILEKLPAETTRVIIAHRLNTIENADEIYFVNAGEVTNAGSFHHVVDKLQQRPHHN